MSEHGRADFLGEWVGEWPVVDVMMRDQDGADLPVANRRQYGGPMCGNVWSGIDHYDGALPNDVCVRSRARHHVCIWGEHT